MKNILIIVMALCLLALPVIADNSSANSSASGQINITTQTNASINESQIGPLPGDMFYGFKRFFENVDLFLTFDNAAKAKKEAHYGQLRAVEVHLLLEKSDQLLANNQILEANQTLQLVQSVLADQNADMNESFTHIETALSQNQANDSDFKEVENANRNSIAVLQRVYANAPEQAKNGLLHALNNSINNEHKHEEKMEAKRHSEEGSDENNLSNISNATSNEIESNFSLNITRDDYRKLGHLNISGNPHEIASSDQDRHVRR